VSYDISGHFFHNAKASYITEYHVKAIVERYPNLHLQVNKGEIHRIMHRHIKHGSLWLG
jgi:hypothetical protein